MKEKSTSSRRNFLKISSLGAGLIGSLSSFDLIKKGSDIISGNKDDLHLKIAGYDFPRLKALTDNKVKINRCSYDISKASIGDLNSLAFSGEQTFDVSELGLIPFMLAYSNDKFRDYSLLPIFPLRLFRHKSIFIRADGSIKKPEDLKGKKVGTAGYSSSSLTWIRGMLKDEYGIDPTDIEWVISNKDSSTEAAGKISKQEQVQPEGVTISNGTVGKDESDLLLSGEVDALFHAAEPKAFFKGDPNVVRLFPDSRKAEQDYYTKTGIFPIMHVVAVKTALLDENPWLATSIFDAYKEAKEINYIFMRKMGWAYSSLPWYGQELDETRKLMGDKYYSYGIEANKQVLKTICKYTYDQGLSEEKLSIKDLFHKSGRDLAE
jgi:4,5-dihydroxyphthalate decarboxylase